MNVSSTTHLLRYAGIALLVLGVVAMAAVTLASPESAPRKRWAKYVAELDYEIRFQFLKTSANRMAMTQLLTVVGLVILTFVTPQIILLGPALIVAMAPIIWLRRKHAERVTQMEEQLNAWLIILSNGLRATPSLGEALAASATLIRAPLSQEIEVAIKEIHLGTSIDEAIKNMSKRVNSRVLSSALATLLVGRQTGGDMSRILEESAATLREMARLEGVVRTKTAEGKSQAMVLGAMPFVIIIALQWIDPNWMTPLFNSNMGYAILGGAFALWFSAILLARKILAVDI